MWQWIAEVVKEQGENVGWQRQGLGMVLRRQCVSVAQVRQAEMHDDAVCTAPSLDLAPSVDLAVRLQVEVEDSKAHTAGLRSHGHHGHTLQQRHPCEVARASCFFMSWCRVFVSNKHVPW